MNIRRYFYAAWHGALDGIQKERKYINLESQIQTNYVHPIRPARTSQEVRAFNEWNPERNERWDSVVDVNRRGGRS